MPKGTPGFTPGKKYDKMGWMSSAAKERIFENCRSVGLAQACLEVSLSYAQQRYQFGKPIYSYQGVLFKIADMAMNKV